MTASPRSPALEASLGRATAQVAQVVDRLNRPGRMDLTGIPGGALARTLAAYLRTPDHHAFVITPDLETARRMTADLEFFVNGPVLLFPSSDTTPYLEVAPDRRAAMDRLSTLHHLALGAPWRALVVPASALVRRTIPRQALLAHSIQIDAEEEVDREAVIQVLASGGYIRTPVVEDPGTFSVRGGILDLYPPTARFPFRVELDDWLVLSIKQFDPETQRAVDSVSSLRIHPVRETPTAPEALARAQTHIRDLCDAVDMPSSRARQLVEDVGAGRMFYGIDAFLPAFHERLDSLFDYVPEHAAHVLVDPTAVTQACHDEWEAAEGDFADRQSRGQPSYAVQALYLTDQDLARALLSPERHLALAHRLAVAGAPDEEPSPLAVLDSVDPDSVVDLGGEDHQLLTQRLRTLREQRKDPLEALAEEVHRWMEDGLRVFFCARNVTQADRIANLLQAHSVTTQRLASVESADEAPPPSECAFVVVGSLRSGFLLGVEGSVFVTEEEVFGSRKHRRPTARKRDDTHAFLEDLRELKIGDYVVHIDHGIGRYLGLERKSLGVSQLERMHGRVPASVEVLVVEYAAGDRLYLPVTRLNQIQKLSGKEGQSSKLDRLGGQTFARTKAKVRKRVQALADELLRLYAQRSAAERPPLPSRGSEYEQFEAAFSFEETPDQARAIEDVLGDFDRPRPMDRVVCGDVGFGKTEVAMRAAFRMVMSGRQVALLCPTTVLAQQHYMTFTDRFRDHPVRLEVLSRFVDRSTQAKVLAGLKDGTVDIVVGTHRLLSKDIHFGKLGLLVVDEEQRFGVTHKERLKKLRASVDVLTLSATPIPRTLQLAIGGLRDLSLIATPPVDRRAVRTFVSRWDERVVAEAIRREMARGGQVFFVYNRVEGLYERAQKVQQLVPDARVAVAHGQMKPEALERTMTDFVDGRFDVLASTAIVESGLDIPRANTIIIDRADIFGLAQLYQLRGRVGRSRERAYCYLLTPPPSRMSDEARARIEALERFTELGSGFHVASLDMEQRGAGDILGAEQSGNVALVGFDLFVHMLEDAVAELRGETVVHEVDPELSFDAEHYLAEDYVEDVGLRLSLYKRFACAADEQAVADLAAELEERFGPPPPEARLFVEAMALKPALRSLRVLGCDATQGRVVLHFREDTPLDATKMAAAIADRRNEWRLSPDLKLTCRFRNDDEPHGIARSRALLRALEPLKKVTPIP